MRTLLAAGLLFGLSACSSASDKNAAAKKEAEKKTLKIGDPAPPLSITKWLNGPEVKGFAPGNVYVLDFWATWCGPCIKMMPHLAELSAEHKGEGLVVIPVTTADKRNPLKAIEEFVKKRGPKLGLTFAVDETQSMDESYMIASGSDALPTTFVIDKAGKVAFIGHPMQLDDVLPKVLAGTWRGQADIEELKKQDRELGAVFDKAEKDPAAAVKELAAFTAHHPEKAKRPIFQVTKLQLLVLAKQYDEAKALTEKLIPELTKKKNVSLLTNIVAIWANKGLNPEHKHANLAVQAAEAALKIEGPTNSMALMNAAEAHFAAGDKAKSIELIEKDQKNAEDEGQRTFFEHQLKRYKGEEKKKEEKK
jgi:thiol-disulfide isomerase/thioredoxin